MKDVRTTLTALWIFVMLNYLYCDILGLMDPVFLNQYLAGEVSGLKITEGFLLSASVLMEIPISLTLVSRLAPYPVNRWANVGAGAVMTLAQGWSLTVGSPTGYYLFFSALEIAGAAMIAILAWRWRAPVDVRV